MIETDEFKKGPLTIRAHYDHDTGELVSGEKYMEGKFITTTFDRDVLLSWVEEG